MERKRYTPDHPEYPVRLLTRLEHPPPFTATGPLPPVRAVAIVGSRTPLGEAAEFARRLAATLADHGIVVVSGGARGIDTAAHLGAVDAGGATWVVCPSGADHVVPSENALLFERIAESEGGRLVWPFPDDIPAAKHRFLDRNRILVALSEAVVVIQARLQSGSRNATTCARNLGIPVWMPPAPPWGLFRDKFGGTLDSIEHGDAVPLVSEAQLLRSLGVEPPKPIRTRRPKVSSRPLEASPTVVPDETWTEDEILVFSKTSLVREFVDSIIHKSALPTPRVRTALLTLSLKDVVVEGPDGYFRRKS